MGENKFFKTVVELMVLTVFAIELFGNHQEVGIDREYTYEVHRQLTARTSLARDYKSLVKKLRAEGPDG